MKGSGKALSINDFHASKEATGLSRTVDVGRVASPTAVEVLLIGVGEVLNAGVHLQLYVIGEPDIVGQFRVEREEGWCVDGFEAVK